MSTIFKTNINPGINCELGRHRRDQIQQIKNESNGIAENWFLSTYGNIEDVKHTSVNNLKNVIHPRIKRIYKMRESPEKERKTFHTNKRWARDSSRYKGIEN